MKTHEEIKKGLECCVTRYNCHFDDEQCCYHSGGASCHYDVMKDALAYIKQLEEGIDRVYEQAKRLRQQFGAQSGTDMNVPTITGETSDGYHTFNELYHHRAVLFSVIVKAFPDKAWKSRLHSDGSMFDGMFIVGIDTPDGPATYHYDIEPYWDMFRCIEFERAPEWDGHTAEQAINRIMKLEPVRHGRWIPMYEEVERLTTDGWGMEVVQTAWKCSECGREELAERDAMPCCHCGTKMDLEVEHEV